MVERWSIEPSPSSRDPKRHTLFLKADKVEVFAVLREFGAMCGRPQKSSKAKFNYSILLHAVDPQDIQSVEKFLAALSENGTAHASPRVSSAPEPERTSPPPLPREVAAPAPVPAPAPAPAPPAPAAKREPWDDAASTADPRQTFDILVVGPFNRFGHAAGTAVVSNPGSMYNPLVLFGVPGVGKTHFLTAMAHSLQARSGAGRFLLTSGPKLARAVAAAAAQGKAAELQAHVQTMGGLLVDDAHLMTFSDRNQAGLKTLLHHFLGSSKPVVMTSVYPPKALQFMEEALQFQISSGYAVEIKLAAPEVQVQILRSVLRHMGFDAGEGEAKELQAGLGHAFFEMNRWLRRIRAQQAIRSARGESPALKTLIDLLTSSPDAPVSALLEPETVKELLSRQAPWETSKAADAKTLGLVFPAGHDEYAQYALLQFRDAATRAGLSLPVRAIAAQAYDPNQLYGVPVGIGDGCEHSGAAAVLMLGPAPRTQLAAREAELQHALDHILASLGVPLSVVPFAQLQDPGQYFRAVLDLYFGLWEGWKA